MNQFRTIGRATLLAALASASVPNAVLSAQEQDQEMVVCICVTSTREEPITIFGIQVGTKTVTTTQCWYDDRPL